MDKNFNNPGLLFISGVYIFKKCNPKNINENPIITSPQELLLLSFENNIGNPNPININVNEKISNLKPRMEISQAVTVVPIFAPIITPMDSASDNSPAFTKLTTITVVADDD